MNIHFSSTSPSLKTEGRETPGQEVWGKYRLEQRAGWSGDRFPEWNTEEQNKDRRPEDRREGSVPPPHEPQRYAKLRAPTLSKPGPKHAPHHSGECHRTARPLWLPSGADSPEPAPQRTRPPQAAGGVLRPLSVGSRRLGTPGNPSASAPHSRSAPRDSGKQPLSPPPS